MAKKSVGKPKRRMSLASKESLAREVSSGKIRGKKSLGRRGLVKGSVHHAFVTMQNYRTNRFGKDKRGGSWLKTDAQFRKKFGHGIAAGSKAAYGLGTRKSLKAAQEAHNATVRDMVKADRRNLGYVSAFTRGYARGGMRVLGIEVNKRTRFTSKVSSAGTP